MIVERNLPDALRTLRRERGLSLGEVAHRASVSINSLQGWESGRQIPKGSSLSKVLDALGAPERTRTRLLAVADPAFARIVLAKNPLGPPLSLGTVLRAMRLRRGMTQATLARTLGVTQGAVAKWESGDSTPSGTTLHELGFTLGATVEETVALVSAQGGMPDGLPEEPGPVSLPYEMPFGLREVIFLGYEAELWRRAASDARWEVALCGLLGQRANHHVMQGRHSEVSAVAKRAVGLATTVEGRVAAAPAVNALTEIDTRRGRSPANAARVCGAWAADLPASVSKSWLIGAQGMNLIRVGRINEGIELVARARDMDDAIMAYGPEGEANPGHGRAQSMAYAYLEAGQPEKAATVLAPYRLHDADQIVHAMAEHGCGRALDEASLRYLRHYVRCVPHNVSAKNLQSLEEIERRQAQLTGEPPEWLDSDPSDAVEARRLWEAVPGAKPWTS